MSERPAWCPKKDCEFLHAVQDKVCAGRMSALDSQETGFEYTHRICLLLKGQPRGLNVNDADVAELRGLLDCMDAGGTTPRKEEVERRLEQPPRATSGAVADDAIGPGTSAFLRKQAD